jgi:hypothetical protein
VERRIAKRRMAVGKERITVMKSWRSSWSRHPTRLGAHDWTCFGT